MGEVDPHQLEAALEPVRQRIRSDALRVSPVWQPMFEVLERRIFDASFSIGSLRRWLGSKPADHLEDFEAKLGCGPADYLRQLRLAAAHAIGEIGGLRRCQVARRSGFRTIESLRAAKRRAERTAETKAKPAAEPPAPGLPAKTRRVHSSAPLRRLLIATGDPVETEHLREQLEAMARADALPSYERRWIEWWWAKVRALPLAQLREELAATPFETAAMCEFLCERSREEGRDDRQRGVVVAELAQIALERSAHSFPAQELGFWQVKVWGCVGNARSLALDFAGAEAALDTAAGFLPAGEIAAELGAEVTFYRSVLRCSQRRLAEAFELAEEALRWLGDRPGRLQAQILLARAQAHAYQGEPGRAIPDFQAALAVLEGLNEPFLCWIAQQNLTMALWEVGRLAEVATCLQRTRALAAGLGRLAAWWHTVWLEGLLADQQGRAEDAAARLREACEGLRGLGKWGDSAVAALDLAKVEAGRGEHESALRWAAQALPHLELLQLESEGLAALALLRQGVEARQLSASVLAAARRHAARAAGVAEPPSSREI